ncbi:MAG: transcriptional regulator, partial [Actinobacteria bacterium]|nr:transcriptional regulator [Actinomycetota bacterium]
MANKKASPVEWRSECPISSGLDILGDKWSLLIVRDLITYGTRTYSEFSESPERISTNILADRLKLLTALGIIERVDADRSARNNAFQLTK